MPRAILTKTTAKGPYPTFPIGAGSLSVTFGAANVSDKNEFVPSGDDLILVHNTGTAPYTFTVTSAPDPQNRTGDVATYSVAAGVIAAFRVKMMGWVQADGKIYLEANSADIKFAIITL